MQKRPVVMALSLASLTALSWAADAPSAQFNLQQSTMAPGTTLQPGSYSIRVVDHLQDRYLVKVEGKAGGSRAMFIAVPSKALVGRPGAVNWSTAPNGEAALRGFVFKNGDSPLEFVYPKDEAVSLAKANNIPVLAIDPASEGKSPELAQLSNDDLQMVTLWMLTPGRVSAPAGTVNISAAKYENKAQPSSDPSSGQQEAIARPKPAILKQLPHTASALPTLLLAGFVAACFAGLLRTWRTRGTEA